MSEREWVPGPWYNAPRWWRVYAYARWVLPYRLMIPWRMVQWAWGWYVTYRHAPKEAEGSGWHNKLVGDDAVFPCVHVAWELARGDEDERAGRWYRMEVGREQR